MDVYVIYSALSPLIRPAISAAESENGCEGQLVTEMEHASWPVKQQAGIAQKQVRMSGMAKRDTRFNRYACTV